MDEGRIGELVRPNPLPPIHGDPLALPD